MESWTEGIKSSCNFGPANRNLDDLEASARRQGGAGGGVRAIL